MIIHYISTILLSIFFSLVTNLYLTHLTTFKTNYFEIFFGVIQINLAISCYFKDPGIVTIKSSLKIDPEDFNIPDGLISGKDFYELRYCKTCELDKPPKATHCKFCNNCVKGFDHHCMMIGNCIGIRNRKIFWYFLIFGTIKNLYGLILTLIAIFFNIKLNH